MNNTYIYNKTPNTTNKDNIIPLIFKSKISGESRLIPFKLINNTLGQERHFPSATKEWLNSIYAYSPNYSKNLISADKSLANILKSYFNMFFKRTALKEDERIPMRFKRLSTNKIFFGKAEIKHTSTNVNITLYVYNEQRRLILRKIRNIERTLFPSIFKRRFYSINDKLSLLRDVNDKATSFQEFEKEFMLIAYYKLLLSLNKSKFEDVLIKELKLIVEKIYNKQVEFNIINLKTPYLNSDIFTEAISQKLKNRKNKLLRVLNTSLKLVKIPNMNKAKEKYETKDEGMLWLNKYKNLSVGAIESSDGLDILNDTLLNSFPNKALTSVDKENYVKNTILNAIKYKKISGVRLEAKGRLTKRFTASRSLFKVKWKGTLKNIDSSYRGLSTVMLRGHVKPNLQYSLVNSKTRNGSFGLKGWVSSK